MSPQDTVAYGLSRQRELLRSNRIDELVNSISVTDRSAERSFSVQNTSVMAQIVTSIRAIIAGAGSKLAAAYSLRRPSTS